MDFWVALGAIATLVLAAVTVAVVLLQNRWTVRHERTNALKALAAELRLNLAVLKGPSGYGRSAAFRHNALDGALPFIGDLPDDLQTVINDAAVAMALRSRVAELQDGDALPHLVPEQAVRRDQELKEYADNAVQAVEAAASRLEGYLRTLLGA